MQVTELFTPLYEAITPRREKDMMTQFTCGSCMYLAYALNKKFGFPIDGFLVDEDFDDEPDDIVHVWVDLGNGMVADIYGIQDAGEFAEEWQRKADRTGDYEYHHDIDPEWVLARAKEGRWTPQREKFHRDALKQAYRAIVDILQPEFEEEFITDDRGGLGSAPAGTGNQGVSARGYGTVGAPGEPKLP